MEGGEFGRESGERNRRRSYEYREHDEDEPERDELEREMHETTKEVEDFVKELEHRMEVEERARDIIDEIEREMEEEDRELDVFERDLGHNLEEAREDLHDDFVNNIEKRLEKASNKEITVEDESFESDTGSSSEMTESSESYEYAGTGMVYALETKSESEPQSEVEGEIEDETCEHTEESEPVNEIDDSPDEQFRNHITKQESSETELEESPSYESIEDVEKQEIQQPESKKPSENTEPEISKSEAREQDRPEIEFEESNESETGGSIESVEGPEQNEVKSESEESFVRVESSDGSEAHDETEVDKLQYPIETDVESQSEPESQEVSDDAQNDAESTENGIEEPEVDEVLEVDDLPEDLVDFVRGVQDLLDEMDADDGYDYVQDPLTGEMQRVPRILVDYESEDQKRRRKLRNLFAELSEQEREKFKEIVRKREETDDRSFAEQVESLWTQVVNEAEQNRNEMIDYPEDFVPWEINTWDQFQSALDYHNGLRFWETFDKQYELVQDYLDGKRKRKPKLLKKVESLELKRFYENMIGMPPEVTIESMQDVESLLEKYKLKPLSPEEREVCKKYFEVCTNWSLTEKELASLYGISPAKAGRWRNRNEPLPISRLRKIAEAKILKDWAILNRFKPEPKSIPSSSAIHKESKQVPQRPNEDDLNLFYLYEDAYFYFKNKNKLAQFIMNIKQTQGLNDAPGLHSTLQYLNKLLVRTFPQNRTKTFISLRYNRIKGEYLQFLLKLSTWTTGDLEKSISQMTDVSGPGGIPNPRFPEGSELETVLSRIISVVVSDSHLRSNGSIMYHEPDIRRIRIVENYLQVLGDIKLNPIFKERTNHYVTELPAVIGKVLLKLGLTPGNKTINNPGLFPSILDFSRKALCAIFEELVPQDGTVKPNRIDWSHSHTLFSGNKKTENSIRQIIGKEEVELVKNRGTPYDRYKRLSMGRLEKLTKNKDKRISKIASELMNQIYNNPNNLIEYEVEIARRLGVELIHEPQSIFYHKRTGAVTVSWNARTANKIEAIKLSMIAPPNDVKKRKVMQKTILNNPDIVDDILNAHTGNGVDIERWWNKE